MQFSHPELPHQYDEEAHALRCRLLAYRFAALDETKIEAGCLDTSLSPRANQVMAPLLSVLPAPDLKAEVLSTMRAAEEAVAAERAASIEGQLLDVLVSIDLRNGPATVGRVADAYRSRYGADADRPISARLVGSVLTQPSAPGAGEAPRRVHHAAGGQRGPHCCTGGAIRR